MDTPTEGDVPAERQGAAEDEPLKKVATMKKAMNLVMEEAEVVELIRILMDDDADGALSFLKVHFKGKARDLLEGG